MARTPPVLPRDEVAFDFVDMGPIVERMLDAFWMDIGEGPIDHASIH